MTRLTDKEQVMDFLNGHGCYCAPITLDLIKYFSIRIEWPERNRMDVYPLGDILGIYTAEEIKDGFKGNLEGDAWFCLVGRSRDVNNWAHALRHILNTHTFNNTSRG